MKKKEQRQNESVVSMKSYIIICITIFLCGCAMQSDWSDDKHHLEEFKDAQITASLKRSECERFLEEVSAPLKFDKSKATKVCNEKIQMPKQPSECFIYSEDRD